METKQEQHVRQAMSDKTTTGRGLVTRKRRATVKMEETRIESKARLQQQKQTDRRPGQQTKMQLKQKPKTPTKGLDVPTDAKMIAYGRPKVPRKWPAS